MRWIVVFAAAGLLAGCATTRPAGLSSQSLVGAWRCGPTAMHGPTFDMAVSTETINRADGRYTSLTTSVITPHGKSPVVIQDRASGIWLLEGDILASEVQEVKFLSSSDPSISNERGQKMQDDLLKKKSIYRSRILKFTRRTLRIIPVEPTDKEAEVESLCKRV